MVAMARARLNCFPKRWRQQEEEVKAQEEGLLHGLHTKTRLKVRLSTGLNYNIRIIKQSDQIVEGTS